MNRLDLELKLKELDPSGFQRLCDYLLNKQGYKIIPFGNSEGRNVVRKGTPDSYIFNENDKTMIFVEYTIQSKDLNNKIISDVNKCLEKTTGFKEYVLNEIYYFTNSNNVDPAIIDSATTLCNSHNVKFKLFTQFEICELVYRYKSVIRDYFNETLDDDLLLSLDDFIDYTKALKGIDHSFEFVERIEDEKKIHESINSNLFSIITGEPGVGKSMLVVQALKKYYDQIVCIRKANENSLDYVFEASKNCERLIVFIDDVNEIASFKRFLELLSLQEVHKIRVICTVREYAVSSISSAVDNYSFIYSVIKIDRVSDTIIKQIIEKNLCIRNPQWLDKIAFISRGNPRLAIMAGNVALSDGVNCLIDSKAIMEKYFEISTSDRIKQLIDKYLNILGFIAFTKNVEISNLSAYSELLELFNVDEKKFKECINILNESEIISLFENAVIQIDDQNLSDYILERALIDNKCCNISDLIIKLIKTRKKQVVECLNIILNIYSSESSRIYVNDEVLKAWKALEGTPDFNCFINIFNSFDINKSLVFYKTKIESSNKFYKGNFDVYKKVYGTNDDIDSLSHISRHHNNYSAFQILLLCLDYCDVRNYAFNSIVSFASLSPENFISDEVKNDFIFKITDYKDKPWFDFLLFSIIDEGLKFSFEHTTMTNEKTMFFSRLDLKDEYSGIGAYRKCLWELSFMLSDKRKYELILSFKNKYPNSECKKLFKQDIEMISKLLKSIKDRNILKEELFKIQMLDVLRRCGIDSGALQIASEDNLDKLIFILDPLDKRLTYEERKNKHALKVKEFGNSSSIDDIRFILFLCDKINEESNNYSYKLNDFLNLLLYELDSNKLNKLTDVMMQEKISCGIKCALLDSNYKAGNVLKTLKYLFDIESDSDMIEATFFVFDRLREEDINNDLKVHFDRCFKLDLEKTNCRYRRTDTLYKFSNSEKQFIEYICLLNNIKEKNNNKFNSWIDLLFNYLCFEPKSLVEMFDKNNKLIELEELILYVGHTKMHEYDLNKYIFEIAKKDKGLIEIIVDKLLDYKENLNHEIISGIWNQEESFILADIIFDRICAFEGYLFLSNYLFEHIFITSSQRSDNNNKFLIWANEKINKISDNKSIKLLTELVSKCSGDLCNKYYVSLITKHIDAALFKEILCYPLSCSWSGSEVNVYIPKINKFKEILALIPDDLQYLEYRSVLEDYITKLEKSIRLIRIEEKINCF